jgi:tripartite-type tricarboxylate transporter receptor subunit TctC
LTHASTALRRALAAGAALLGLAAATAGAQDFPSKPIRLVVPFAAGGGNDLLARIVSQEFQKKWGQPAVVENRPGAGGNIGAEFVAKSAPDGYTLLLGTNTLAMAPFISRNMGFDVQRDLAPVAMLTSTPFMVLVNPTLPVKNIRELVAYAKANPGKLSYATPGIGTPHHLGTELFKTTTGTFMVHIAYRGSVPAMTDLMTNQVQVMWATINVALPQVAAGKLRALAIAEPKRLASLKDVPTVAETLPGYEVSAWYAVFAPGGTPAPLVTQLSTELQRIYQQPDVVQRLQPLGYEPAISGPAPLAATLAADLKKWEKVVREANIKGE